MTGPADRHALKARAAAIKDRCNVVDVASRHAPVSELPPRRGGRAGGYGAPCPRCRTGRVRIPEAADTYRCGSCGHSGDAITYEREAAGASFSAACAALEAAFPVSTAEAGGASGDLFGGGP